ncbi:hypothetical protein FVB9288_03097 [Flavobacterium sp. CECT 9288]|nr:hypothetical protein FVB9288_03097 [Flavobacterium sp. CECT 9288]
MQSCSTEEALMQNETTIKTVSKQEAIQFLQNSNGLNGTKSKSTNVPLVFDFERITHEKTSHKEALITVIPAQSDIKDKKTRVILWKVDNTIESIVYNEYASESSTINSFTGIIIMKRLNGDFIRAYKLKNNNYVIDLLPIKKDATSKSSNSFGEEPFGLHEVIVINNFKKTSYNFVPMIDRNKSVSDLEDYYWLKSGGGGGYTGAEPVVEEEKTPCDQIKAQIDNVAIKAKIDALKGKTADKNEAGIVQKKDGTFIDLLAATNSNELNMPSGTNFIGSMHTHQDPYPSGRLRENGTPIMLVPIPIFSPKDVVQFLEFLNNTKKNNAPIEDVYNTMISSSAVYQLRFSGNITDVKIDFDISVLNDKYLKSIKDNGNDKKLGFLKFLEDNIGIKGIDLYEINSDNSTIKITLDNNKLSNIPCK